MGRKKSKPVFENIEVTGAGAKGKSVAKAPDGKVIFLTGAIPGDVVDIQAYKKRKAYYEGKVLAIKSYSDKRTEPKCEHFGVCGGCKWQAMGYEHQLFFKEQEVLNNLQRIGKVAIEEVVPISASTEQYLYRNKMEFSFSDSRWLSLDEIQSEEEIENRNALGFHIPGMWDKILDLNECHLQAEPSNSIRLAVRDFAIKNKLPFFNTRKQEGLLRTLMLRSSSNGQFMVLVQFFRNDEEDIKLLMEFIKTEFPAVTSLQYVVNSKGNDTIYDQEVVCYYGQDFIEEEMEGLRFKINAKSFYQTNAAQAYELYKITRDFAGLTGEELVYDLYTGTGTIAQFVARNAKKVIGVESVPEAITDAKANALNNKIDNVEFYVGDMKKVFTAGFVNEHGVPDVVITDPPRDGMHKDVVAQLLAINAKRIVYVSCNSATQARDLALLDESYKVVKSQAVDMFPQTHHVENVVLLELR